MFEIIDLWMKMFIRNKKTFCSSTLNFRDIDDCLGLNIENIRNVSNIIPSLIVPNHVSKIEPSKELIKKLELLRKTWGKDEEKSRRAFIDTIIFDVLEQSNSNLQLRTKEFRKWKGPKITLQGNVDYIIGSSVLLMQVKDCRLGGSHLQMENHISQIIAAIGCTQREMENSETPVFGILTDATSFQFFAITDGKVFCSGDHSLLNIPDGINYANNEQFKSILRWFKFFTME